MKFGTFYLLEKPAGLSDQEVYRNSVEQCVVSDELGFDGVWLAEHRFTHYGILPDTLLFGAHIAALTKKVRIGTAVTVLPFHHPIRLAEQIAMIDVLSNGRFDWGIGRGYQAGEYAGFNISMDESRARFTEVLDIVIGLLTHDRFSYEGQFFQVRDVSILPKPIQKPHPPIWMTVMRTPESFEFLAHRQYYLMSGNPYRMDPEFRQAFEMYKETLRRAGKSEAIDEAIAMIPTYLADDNELAKAEPRASVESFMAAFKEVGSPTAGGRPLSKDYARYAAEDSARSGDYDTQVEVNFLFGDPDHVIEKLKRFEELGIKYVICCMNRGGAMEQKNVLK
ncbi:MAG: LLM class flavin-dependent oxidoreductase, partial [Candidatus Tectomicrobia bacterium]|nr:LLM class flavin-dependent oxidoreductase [Candidatus Tectomicrobia bacterium]